MTEKEYEDAIAALENEIELKNERIEDLEYVIEKIGDSLSEIDRECSEARGLL